jgi:ribosomal protein S18 acetylase RimI-like enzyme
MTDVAELASLMARAFQDDPVTRWILPDDDLRRRRLPAVYGMQMRTWYVPWGRTDAVVHDGRLAAAALWSPPDRPHPSPAAQLRQLPIALRTAGRGFGRVISANRSLVAARPGEPHWYLAEIATDPPVQGLGLGGRLVRHGLARCDRDGVPGYLEAAEHNVPYYERFGFAVTRAIEFRSGPTVFGMLRPPP